LQGECPRLASHIAGWDDSIKLRYLGLKDCKFDYGPGYTIEFVRGYNSILAEFVGEKAITRVYQFGSQYKAG